MDCSLACLCKFSELGRHLMTLYREARDTAVNRRGVPTKGRHGKERLGGEPGEAV